MFLVSHVYSITHVRVSTGKSEESVTATCNLSHFFMLCFTLSTNSFLYCNISMFFTGAYGTVYRARDKMNDTIVALKKMRFTLTEDGVPMAILREISLLKQLERHLWGLRAWNFRHLGPQPPQPHP